MWLEKVIDARRDAKRQARFQHNENYYIQGAHGFSG
jgi:hypothetical protein